MSQAPSSPSPKNESGGDRPSLTVYLINGSPSRNSKTGAVLNALAGYLNSNGLLTVRVSVRDFPADDLVLAQFDSPASKRFIQQIASAHAVVLGTPIYKAAYTGALKALLDLLPQDAFKDKVILPVATGGTLAHYLALDYALRPVIAALGGSRVLSNVFFTDRQLRLEGDRLIFDEESEKRFKESVEELTSALGGPNAVSTPPKG